MYCNLLQCSHFADTAILARCGGEVVGFVSGYRRPSRPDTLFVWQIVVAPAARGQGLANRLLEAQLSAAACRGVRFIETTITRENTASRRVFTRFAESRAVPLEEHPGFDRDLHFEGQHASEYLIRIGPFA